MSRLTADGLKYDGPNVTTGTTAPALSRMYESLAALKAAVPTAEVIEFGGSDEDKPVRLDLTVGQVGNDDTTSVESLWMVRSAGLDGSVGVLAEKLADIVWTTSASDSIASAQGGRENHKFPKSATVTDTGVAEARTGHALRKTADGAPPATVTLYDVGPAIAIVRTRGVGNSSPVTAVAGISSRWR